MNVLVLLIELKQLLRRMIALENELEIILFQDQSEDHKEKLEEVLRRQISIHQKAYNRYMEQTSPIDRMLIESPLEPLIRQVNIKKLYIGLLHLSSNFMNIIDTDIYHTEEFEAQTNNDRLGTSIPDNEISFLEFGKSLHKFYEEIQSIGKQQIT